MTQKTIMAVVALATGVAVAGTTTVSSVEDMPASGGEGTIRYTGATGTVTKDVTLTLPNVMIGTPAYMSPEHLMDSKKVDIRSDIYSLGIVLWEMLAGEPPNAGLTTSELIAKAYSRKRIPDIRTKRPRLPRRIVLLLRKMTAPRPETRFQHPEEILAFLDEYAERTRRNFQMFLASVAAISSFVLLLAVRFLLRAY